MTQVMGTSLTRFGYQSSKSSKSSSITICKNQVEVPASLEAGEYVLSFRWDCKCTPQVILIIFFTLHGVADSVVHGVVHGLMKREMKVVIVGLVRVLLMVLMLLIVVVTLLVLVLIHLVC